MLNTMRKLSNSNYGFYKILKNIVQLLMKLLQIMTGIKIILLIKMKDINLSTNYAVTAKPMQIVLIGNLTKCSMKISLIKILTQ